VVWGRVEAVAGTFYAEDWRVKKKAKKRKAKAKKKAGGVRRKKQNGPPAPRPPHDPDDTDYAGPRVFL